MKSKISNIINTAGVVFVALVVFYIVCVNPPKGIVFLTHWGPPAVFVVGMILVLFNRKEKC